MANGLFAEYGLLVEILDPPPPPGTTNPHRVARGGADFCLTGVTYYLQALEEGGHGYPVRFVSMIHQRSPLGAIVPADCGIQTLEDLQGRRLGRLRLKDWLADEFVQSLADRGIAPPASVPLEGSPEAALARGEIEIVPTFVDAINSVRNKGTRPVRAIHVGGDLYATGLLAGDRIPADVVERMRIAIAAALTQQERDPEAGLAEYLDRYPRSRREHALEGWALMAPYALSEGTPGRMDQRRWSMTLDWLSNVHGFPRFPAEWVYRPELAVGTAPASRVPAVR